MARTPVVERSVGHPPPPEADPWTVAADLPIHVRALRDGRLVAEGGMRRTSRWVELRSVSTP